MITLTTIITVLLTMFGIGIVLSLLLLAWVLFRVKRANLAQNAGFITTLRQTPLSVVLLLDALDFALDFLSAPFAWVLLGYLGLKSLRTVTVIESFIPFSDVIPTMTIAWILVRLIKPETLSGIFPQEELPDARRMQIPGRISR